MGANLLLQNRSHVLKIPLLSTQEDALSSAAAAEAATMGELALKGRGESGSGVEGEGRENTRAREFKQV